MKKISSGDRDYRMKYVSLLLISFYGSYKLGMLLYRIIGSDRFHVKDNIIFNDIFIKGTINIRLFYDNRV